MVQQNNVGTTQEGMAAARVEFENKVQIFNGQLSSVNQEMSVLQSTWTGTASTNFNTAMDNWEGGFKRVITALISMIESLGGNAKLYEGQESDAASIANDFGAVLGGNAVGDVPVAAPGI